MIISWFSQPPEKGLSSYYQHDTVTGEFTRIRLELGREASAADPGHTFISFDKEHIVGFSPDDYLDDDETGAEFDAHFTVDGDGALCYDDIALQPGPPNAKDYVYDCSNGSDEVHSGNPVTDTPTLPPGIEAKHLALLANESFLAESSEYITTGNISQAELAHALQRRVCDILGVDDFVSITDGQILAKLSSQVKSISDAVTDQSASDLAESLEGAQKAANEITAEINKQIDNGITPNQEFETAFESLKSALDNAQGAHGQADLASALAEISLAQGAVKTAIESITAAEHAAVSERLNGIQDALGEAHQQATEWQAVEAEYEPLTEAQTIEDYEREIGVGAEEIA